MEIEDEKKEIIVERKEAPIKDIVSLYFWIRQKINEVKDSYSNYELMMESISIGVSLINDDVLEEEVSVFLNNQENYPKITDMEIQDNNTYSIGSGISGTISVRPEDLVLGRQHLIDQQCNNIIPRLRILDNKILKHLIKNNIISSYNVFEIFEKKLRSNINAI